MPNCCICFTSDAGYLFPTVVSAIQARANSGSSSTDVAIYHFGAEPQVEEIFARVCLRENIQFTRIGLDVIERSHPAYARLFLDRFVPPQYSQLLYMDGDVQIADSLDPLINASVPPGHFLAAADPIAFHADHISGLSEWSRSYFKTLGSTSTNYFNSGVLRINRAGWAALASKAYDFCRRLPAEYSRYWDQDGLNAVAGSFRLPLSIKWNFPIFMRNCRVEKQLDPIVYHFSSSPKPWNGNFPPWNRTATLPYAQIIRKYPQLVQCIPPFSRKRKVKYYLQQRFKQYLETLTWGFSAKRDRILAYESLLALNVRFVDEVSAKAAGA